jgi:hypothetical protein
MLSTTVGLARVTRRECVSDSDAREGMTGVDSIAMRTKKSKLVSACEQVMMGRGAWMQCGPCNRKTSNRQWNRTDVRRWWMNAQIMCVSKCTRTTPLYAGCFIVTTQGLKHQQQQREGSGSSDSDDNRQQRPRAEQDASNLSSLAS